MRRHCLDEAALLKTTYEDWLESLRQALSYFKTRVSNVSAAGVCVGGALALQLAHQEKDQIDKVVIYAPALDYDGWNQPYWSPYARVFKDILIHIPFVRNAQFKETYPFVIKDDRVRKFIAETPTNLDGALPYFPARSLYQNYRLNDVLKKELPKIRVPTLLIHAKDDDVSHPRNSHLIKKRHGGSCDLVLLEDCYHMIHVDRERHKVAELTGRFFETAL